VYSILAEEFDLNILFLMNISCLQAEVFQIPALNKHKQLWLLPPHYILSINLNMEKAYRNISYLFVTILFVAFIGFFQTYFIQFPTFSGSNNIQHFHAIMMLCWMAMLIIQPLLIKYKKIDWHRQLGKVSYFQVTLILASFFLIGRTGYLRDAVNLPQAENIGLLALTIPDMFGFSILYILAMVNKNRAAIHMRYIIGASLLMISPRFRKNSYELYWSFTTHFRRDFACFGNCSFYFFNYI
jgi:hypothetical protein